MARLRMEYGSNTTNQGLLTLHSPAKINWFLRVTGRREDGYHDIYTLMQTINLYDTLSFELTSGDISIDIVSDSTLDIPPEKNLIYKAANLLKKTTGCQSGISVTLRKKIPVQAGLGGGSSNAATTLLGLNILWGTRLSVSELSEIGAGVGSDVPFFIHGGIAVAEGRGEAITAFDSVPKGLALLIVKPDYGVSTPAAYRGIRNYSRKDPELPSRLIDVLINRKYERLPELISNDLEEPVFYIHPELRDIKERLLREGADAALLCGSGSSVFGVYRTRTAALRASESFRTLWHTVVETI
jgi:4-diphosphocytidyl-2-C-methyl-D-erythritol kinase